jgi:hypothetical protein
MGKKKQKRKRYDQDLTLTETQAKRMKFGDERDFRARSNETQVGHKSGYHESAVTTDTFNFLSKAVDLGTGKHRLSTANSKSFFNKHSGGKVYTKSLEYVLGAADQYRTDTARTALSASEGLAAGHTGSGLSTKNQADAHDLLRKSVMGILVTDPSSEPGLSQASVNTLFAAITVTSVAPAELARTIKGTLKDKEAGAEWEAKRNEAKLRVDELQDDLNDDEKRFVRRKSRSFLKSTQSEDEPTRRLKRKRARSPLRDPEYSVAGEEITGGGYKRKLEKKRKASLAPPKKVSAQGFYATEPFRAKRRNKPTGQSSGKKKKFTLL